MYTLFVKLGQLLQSQQEFLSSWLFWMVAIFRHPFLMWPFPLITYGGFLVSALLQAFAYPGWKARFLAPTGARGPSFFSALALGVTGPPDWRSNLAAFEELLRYGTSLPTAFTYLIASYTITSYFIFLIMVNSGPQIVIGHVLAALLMIACVRLGLRWWIPKALWHQAAAGSSADPHAEAAPAALPWPVCLRSPRNWLRAVWLLLRDIKVLCIPLFLGLLLGGFLAAWGRTEAFFDLRLGDGVPGQLLNAVIGPLLSAVTFMVPVGNIFVGVWLWKTEFLAYAGLVGFFLATVLHPDTVGTYRRLFGLSLTVRIVLILLGSAAFAALAVTTMWYGLAALASLLGVRDFIEQSVLSSSITPSTVPWFHELFKPAMAAYMHDVMGGMRGGM